MLTLSSEVDFEILLTALASEANRNATAKGFWDDLDALEQCTPPDLLPRLRVAYKLSKLALIASEAVGEAVEAVRKPGPDQHLPAFSGETIELADTVIRILDYAKRFNLPLAKAILAKMEFNAKRSAMHGGKLA